MEEFLHEETCKLWKEKSIVDYREILYESVPLYPKELEKKRERALSY